MEASQSLSLVSLLSPPPSISAVQRPALAASSLTSVCMDCRRRCLTTRRWFIVNSIKKTMVSVIIGLPSLACLLYGVKRHPKDSPITALYDAALRWASGAACDAGFCLRTMNKSYGGYLDSVPG
jgi:hypothetical protein